MVNPHPFQFQSKFGKPHKQQYSLAFIFFCFSVFWFSLGCNGNSSELFYFSFSLLQFLSRPTSLYSCSPTSGILFLCFLPKYSSVFLYIVLNSNKDSNLGTRLYPSLLFFFPSYFLFSSVSKFIQLISILCCSDVFLLRQLFLGHNWQN